MVSEKSDKLIILDLDETLVYATKDQLVGSPDFVIGEYLVYKRPFLDKFIAYLDQNFAFAIWSSATDLYVAELTEKLQLNEKAVFCWGRSKATFKRPSPIDLEGSYNTDSNDHHFYIKRLKKVKRLGFDLNKILIIDDTPSKSQTNFGNAIYVSEYKGNQDDTELLILTKYLNNLKNVENVRVIEKRDWKEKV